MGHAVLRFVSGVVGLAALVAAGAGCAAHQAGTSAAVELLPEIDIVELRDDATRALDENRVLKAQLDSVRTRLALLEQRATAAPRTMPVETAPRAPVAPTPSPVPPVATVPRLQAPATAAPARPALVTAVPADASARSGGWYQEGLDAFNARDYVRAEERFAQVLSADSLGAYAPNARYWVGECRYARGDVAGAAGMFAALLAGAESSKHDDAQLKLGMCQLKLGRTSEARSVFEEFLRRYPQSEYADRARGYLERLRIE
jgi:tol-pal system protein YbgF